MPAALASSTTPGRRAPRGLIVAAAVLAVGLPGPASAAAPSHVLYKCVDKAGVTSIQSSACPAGSTTAWRRDATPEAPPTAAQAAQADAKRLRDQQAVRELSAQVDRRLEEAKDAKQTPAIAPPDEELPPPPADDAVNPDLKACQDAQVFANQVRDKDWLGLSEEQVRRLYGWVAQQCKVPSAG